jgi:putative serine protease PepD
MTEHETNPQRHETPGPLTGPEPSHQPADASFESSSPERGPSEPTTAAQPTVPHQPVSPWQQHPYAQPQPGYSPHPGYGSPAGAQYPQYGQQYAGATYGGHTEQQPAWAAPVAADARQPGAGRGRKILAAGAAAVLIALAGGGVGAATVLAMDDDNGGTTPVQTGNSSVSRVVDRSSLASIAAAAQDSVVSITTGNGEGSGVILKADGYVLTNNHVVATAQGATVSVIFSDGKKATATIVGTDPRTDLAVIKADGVSGLKPASFGKSADMQVGDTVLALGSPLGLEGSVTSGIISAKDRTIRSGGEDQNPFGGQQQQATTTMSGLLQTDAPINPGNSGGALVNTNAQVIGINTAIATSGQGAGNIGLGFAIPSDRAIQVANDLMAGRKVSHPQLGVNVAAAENGGALVTNVQPDSAAARAGLQQGDVITTANGRPINDSDDLVAIVQAGKVGDQVTIQFTRDGAQKAVTATLAEAD